MQYIIKEAFPVYIDTPDVTYDGNAGKYERDVIFAFNEIILNPKMPSQLDGLTAKAMITESSNRKTKIANYIRQMYKNNPVISTTIEPTTKLNLVSSDKPVTTSSNINWNAAEKNITANTNNSGTWTLPTNTEISTINKQDNTITSVSNVDWNNIQNNNVQTPIQISRSEAAIASVSNVDWNAAEKNAANINNDIGSPFITAIPDDIKIKSLAKQDAAINLVSKL